MKNAKKEIREKLIELASPLSNDAFQIKDDEIIPETGYLDSAGIIELISWIEERFDIHIPTSKITIDNFGSINDIADYLKEHAP